uniref:Uncharacterized protein n=1 Tax=Anguilla anguilla TaxID=7936 RepID=A0A0E9VPQ7_ANGAN
MFVSMKKLRREPIVCPPRSTNRHKVNSTTLCRINFTHT